MEENGKAVMEERTCGSSLQTNQEKGHLNWEGRSSEKRE